MKKISLFLFLLVPIIAKGQTFSPPAGTYTSGQTVTITPPTGKTCFYTMDGSTPSIAGFQYTTPLSVPATATIKTICVKVGATIRDAGNSSNNWKSVCNVAHNYNQPPPATQFSYLNCQAGGGVGSITPSNLAWSFGNPMKETLATTSSTGSTQALFINHPSSAACIDCTELVQDKIVKVDQGKTYLLNNEMDFAVNMKSTYNQWHTASLQCNQQGTPRWQYDNQQGSWQDTPGPITYGCPISTTQQTEIRYGMHWTNGDTSCSGGFSVDHYDFLTVCVGGTNGTGGTCKDFTINKTLCGFTEPYPQEFSLQDQPDLTNTTTSGANPTQSVRSVWNDNGTLAYFGTEVTASATYNIVPPTISVLPARWGGTGMLGGFGKLGGSSFNSGFIYNGNPGSGNNYYVSPTGSDSNNGLTPATAWLTPGHASTGRVAGDTVIFLDGTYTIPSTNSFRGDWAIQSISGSSGSPIVFKSQHLYGAKLRGSGTYTVDGSVVIGIFGSFITVMGFDISGTNGNGITMAVDGTTDNNVVVTRNYIHDITTPCDSNGGAAVTTGSGNNYEVGNKTFFIDANLIVNILDPSGCTPGTLHGAGIAAMLPFTTVSNNIVINGGRWPIESWHAAHDDIYYGNTVINGQDGLTIGAGDSGLVSGGAQNFLVANNIVINQSVIAIQETGTTGVNTYKNNDSFKGVITFSLQNGNTTTGTVHLDPLFANNTGTASGNYNLRTASPVLSLGSVLASILTDYSGVTRPISGSVPLGAEITVCGYGSTGIC